MSSGSSCAQSTGSGERAPALHTVQTLSYPHWHAVCTHSLGPSHERVHLQRRLQDKYITSVALWVTTTCFACVFFFFFFSPQSKVVCCVSLCFQNLVDIGEGKHHVPPWIADLPMKMIDWCCLCVSNPPTENSRFDRSRVLFTTAVPNCPMPNNTEVDMT